MKAGQFYFLVCSVTAVAFVNRASAGDPAKLLANLKSSLVEFVKQGDGLLRSVVSFDSSERVQSSFHKCRKAIDDVHDNIALIVESKDSHQIYESIRTTKDVLSAEFIQRRQELFAKIKYSDNPFAKSVTDFFDELGRSLEHTERDVWKYMNEPAVKQHIGSIDKFLGTIQKSGQSLYDQIQTIALKQYSEFTGPAGSKKYK